MPFQQVCGCGAFPCERGLQASPLCIHAEVERAQKAGHGDKFVAGDIPKQRGQSAAGRVWEQRDGEMSLGKWGPQGTWTELPAALQPWHRAPLSPPFPPQSRAVRQRLLAAGAVRFHGVRSNPGPIPVGRQRGKGGGNKKIPQSISILIKLLSCLTLSFESTTIHSWHLSSISSPAF